MNIQNCTMGNSQPGHNGTETSPPVSTPTYQSCIVTPPIPSPSSGVGIPVPNHHRSDSFELELSSSLSGISGLSAHMASRNAGTFGSMDGGGDLISPGQYMTRLRANSVSIEAEIPLPSLEVNTTLPAVIKWDKGGNNVSISGTFNKWDKKLPLVKSTNNFYTIVDLAEGEHHYKYYVDGQWVINPDEPTFTDSHGNINNVVRVMKSDFEIVDALQTDGDSVQAKINSSNLSTDFPQSEYGQEIPIRKLSDRCVGPPVLPQHLLQVILNKDISPHLEPGLLPEPNHVMVNHLYALSIKDGVMVLSDTSRFRKKCVTTLLYKPID